MLAGELQTSSLADSLFCYGLRSICRITFYMGPAMTDFSRIPPAPCTSHHGLHRAASNSTPARLALLGVECTAETPEVHEILETLDDAIFAAIAGCPSALAEAQTLWPQVRLLLPGELLEESREQYLRRANEACHEFADRPSRGHEVTLAAVEILEMLTR